VYFIGLRNPGLFTVLVARNANFNRYSIHGWYPPEARSLPVMIYYGSNDPAAIQAQSKAAIQYMTSSGFKVTTAVIPGSGHARHPEVAMKFWLEHWNRPAATTPLADSARPPGPPARRGGN
jgi:predicted esterase